MLSPKFLLLLLARHALHSNAEPFFGAIHHITHAVQSTLGAVVHDSVAGVHRLATSVAGEAAGGHEAYFEKGSGAIDCNVDNQSGLQLTLGSWPVKLNNGGYALRAFAGDWDGSISSPRPGESVSTSTTPASRSSH